MNINIRIFLLLGGLTLSVLAEDKPLGGAVGLRGTIDGSNFSSPSFDITGGKNALTIIAKKNKLKFSIPIDSQGLLDVVLSRHQQAAAVLLTNQPSPSRLRTLATVNAAGERSVFDFKTFKMTKDLGWIVDLGAVSDGGALVLAKCAYMLPRREDGSQWVNHKWVILSVGQGTVKVVETDSAIDKWSEISAVKKDNPDKK